MILEHAIYFQCLTRIGEVENSSLLKLMINPITITNQLNLCTLHVLLSLHAIEKKKNGPVQISSRLCNWIIASGMFVWRYWCKLYQRCQNLIHFHYQLFYIMALPMTHGITNLGMVVIMAVSLVLHGRKSGSTSAVHKKFQQPGRVLFKMSHLEESQMIGGLACADVSQRSKFSYECEIIVFSYHWRCGLDSQMCQFTGYSIPNKFENHYLECKEMIEKGSLMIAETLCCDPSKFMSVMSLLVLWWAFLFELIK